MSRGRKRTNARPEGAVVPSAEPGLNEPPNSEQTTGAEHTSPACSHAHQNDCTKKRAEAEDAAFSHSSPSYTPTSGKSSRTDGKSFPPESKANAVEGESAATAVPASAVGSAGCSRSNSESVCSQNLSSNHSPLPSPLPLSATAKDEDGQNGFAPCSAVSKKHEKCGKDTRRSAAQQSQPCRGESDDVSHCVHSSRLRGADGGGGGGVEGACHPPPATVVSSSLTSAPSPAFPSSSLSFPQFYGGGSSRELVYVQNPDGCGGGGVLRSVGGSCHHHHHQPEAMVSGKKTRKLPGMPPLQSREIQASVQPPFDHGGRNDGSAATPLLRGPSPCVHSGQEQGCRTASVDGCMGGPGATEEKKKGGNQTGGGGSHRARQKLVTASMVCCVFMFVEVVAGVLSNSLALMTDASHLLSDLCAFLISLFALWVSELKGNPSMSFGYHRAEILGALLSVILIWVLTAFLIYAACFRFVDPPAVDGRLMFGTALVGTLANLFMTHILKVHSHGIGQVHAHGEEEEDEGHGGCCGSSSSRSPPPHPAPYPPARHSKASDREGRPLAHAHPSTDLYELQGAGRGADFFADGQEQQQQQHAIRENRDRHMGEEVEEDLLLSDGHTLPACCHNRASDARGKCTGAEEDDGCVSSQRGAERGKDRGVEEESHTTSHVASAAETPTSHCERKPTGGRMLKGGCCGDRGMSPEVNRARPCSGSSAGGSWLSNDVYIRMDDDSDAARQYENMNLRAAYIHALGDLLQNVGVMIASALIWWRPEWSIADPICTFIFSIFVLFTTLSILKEALNVLMEGTPIGIDARALQEDLLLIPGVVEVHDLHVWSLSVGKPSLACHLVVANEDDARSVLRKATVLCQRKYAILHTTIQTDFSSDKRSCETEAHQKCSDPMKVFPRID